LREEALWATHISYMNDASEMVEPFNIAEDILEEYWQELKNSGDIDQKRETIVSNFLVDIKKRGGNICVVSFCDDGDLLSLWRGYGEYNSAYSIGFNVKNLMKDEVWPRFQLNQCIYYPRAQYEREVKSFITNYIESVMNDTMKLTNFLDDFTRKAGTMKLDYFKDEKEWRIISDGPIISRLLSYRKGKSTIIPYYPIKIDISAIAEITIGPCENPELAKSAITSFAYNNGLKDVSIKNYDIPYRIL